MSIQAQIDHIEASILGIEDAIGLNKGRKRPDGMDGFRQLRLDGFRAVLKTLRAAQEVEVARLHGQFARAYS